METFIFVTHTWFGCVNRQQCHAMPRHGDSLHFVCDCRSIGFCDRKLNNISAKKQQRLPGYCVSVWALDYRVP